ncbi:MAG: hypothetical protein AVDCRST_MAG08-4432, partial [uncultured Acetobacteraceae bacterium]
VERHATAARRRDRHGFAGRQRRAAAAFTLAEARRQCGDGRSRRSGCSATRSPRKAAAASGAGFAL